MILKGPDGVNRNETEDAVAHSAAIGRAGEPEEVVGQSYYCLFTERASVCHTQLRSSPSPNINIMHNHRPLRTQTAQNQQESPKHDSSP